MSLSSLDLIVGRSCELSIFTGGKKGATLRERTSTSAARRTWLDRCRVELRVQTAYNKLERTKQMNCVSDELVSLERKAPHDRRAVAHGSACARNRWKTVAQELEAKAGALQAQLRFSAGRCRTR